MPRQEALVTPGLLKWARTTAGLSAETVAAKLRVAGGAEVVAAWESGEAKPSMAQARRLAQIYRRPLEVFYLATPPVELGPVPDFRSTSGAPVRSPDLLWAVRRLRGLRESVLELASDGKAFPAFPVTASLREDPETVGAGLRRALGVTLAEQVRWNSHEKAWKAWRAAAERLGCLVFLLDRIESDNVSGLSVSAPRAPAIGINSTQRSPGRRTFTLLHELAHLALRQEGVCGIEDVAVEVERFCNKVAAAVLLPAQALTEAARGLDSRPYEDEALEHLALRFGTSRQAVFVRLVALGQAPRSAYDRWLRRYLDAERTPAETGRDREGKPTFYNLYLNRMSLPFLREAYQAFHDDRISLNELSNHLGVKPATALAMEERVLQRIRNAGA